LSATFEAPAGSSGASNVALNGIGDEGQDGRVAYDEDLAERIRGLLPDEPITEKRMFGGLAFLVAGNMSIAASSQGGLLVRVDPQLSDRLLEEPGAEPFEMGGRGPMKGWLHVSADAVTDDAALGAWVERGVGYARTLPPK
jgi:TfoX/Sxy family transcriptional regulator of competence genes